MTNNHYRFFSLKANDISTNPIIVDITPAITTKIDARANGLKKSNTPNTRVNKPL